MAFGGMARCSLTLVAWLLVVSVRPTTQDIASPIRVAAWTPAGEARPLDANPPPVLFAVGDIGWCADLARTRATGALMERLLDQTRGSIGITTGDNSNDRGSQDDYDCLDQTPWSTLAPRLLSVPGNHDYETDDIFPYYMLYFPRGRGSAGEGYYSYEFGRWHVVALNSELMKRTLEMQARRQAQLDWLARNLSDHAKVACTIAYFHRPPFSSGRFASPAWVMPLFQQLYAAGVDLVITGHEHFFAAYPPLNPAGDMDEEFGITMLTVGTGGAPMSPDPGKRNYHEMLLAKVPGVLKLTLRSGGYEWSFLNTDEQVPRFSTGRDVSGGGRCHGRPPTPPAN
jgi:acid phosphatase type 7